MSQIEYEGKIYDFKWSQLLVLGIFSPIIALAIYYSNDYVWLHGITAKITVWSLNLLTGLNNQVIYATDSTQIGLPYYSSFTPGWFIIIVGREDGPIRFTTFCTGIQAIAIFIGVILTIPHSLDKKTSQDIWQRKIKAIIYTSVLFYIVNIMRMWLQLYLYYKGYEWEDIHYSISSASSFIAVAAILLIHKYVPEFIMSLLWAGDKIKVALSKNKQIQSQESSVTTDSSTSSAVSDSSTSSNEIKSSESLEENE